MAVQLDDMNPGIGTTGLFWTMPLDENSVEVQLRRGRAEMRAERVHVQDYGSFMNSILGVPLEPATVSFEVHWSGGSSREHVVNAPQEMEGEFIRNSATMEWSATTETYHFRSRPASTSTSFFAEIAREQNGEFFRS